MIPQVGDRWHHIEYWDPILSGREFEFEIIEVHDLDDETKATIVGKVTEDTVLGKQGDVSRPIKVWDLLNSWTFHPAGNCRP